MQLHNAQKKIAKSTARFRVVNAGRRFGKTVLSSEEIKGIVLSKQAKVLYIATTIAQARDIMWNQLKKELQPIIKKANESRLELEVSNKDGKSSFIQLKGWEAIETLRGQAFDFIVLDEVASMRNFWVGWNEVLSPTLIDRKGSCMFISTPKGFNHFYDLYNLREKNKDYESFHFTTYDNPNIPIDEIEREKETKPENTFAQEYLGSFRKSEGLVFKEFRRDVHVYNDESEKQPANIIRYMAGIDFGFTNPTAIIAIRKGHDNDYWITGEWYKTGKTDAQIADVVMAYAFDEVYPDPESPSAIAELQKRGVYCKEVIKNKDSIKNGINRMRALFLKNKLHIHNSCVNLINELETYSYPESKIGRNEEENPVKEHDHAIDATRYALFMDEPVNMVQQLRQESNIYNTRIAKKKGYE